MLASSILAELARDECKSPLFQTAKELIPNNPIVFVRICAWLLSEMCHIEVGDIGSVGGLNGNIAQDGLFLLLCGVVVSQSKTCLNINFLEIRL